MKLNIGGTGKDFEGFLNVDLRKPCDIVHNLNVYPYPFKDNSIKEIKAFHILEHLESKTEPLQELHRITMNNGIIHIRVPWCNSIGGFSDPTHKQFFGYNTFEYYEPSNKLNYVSNIRFKVIKKNLYLYRPLKLIEYLINKNKVLQRIYAFTISGIFPPTELEVYLKVIKDSRFWGWRGVIK